MHFVVEIYSGLHKEIEVSVFQIVKLRNFHLFCVLRIKKYTPWSILCWLTKQTPQTRCVHQGWHIGIGQYSISSDIISAELIYRYRLSKVFICHAYLDIKDEISADISAMTYWYQQYRYRWNSADMPTLVFMSCTVSWIFIWPNCWDPSSLSGIPWLTKAPPPQNVQNFTSIRSDSWGFIFPGRPQNFYQDPSPIELLRMALFLVQNITSIDLLGCVHMSQKRSFISSILTFMGENCIRCQIISRLFRQELPFPVSSTTALSGISLESEASQVFCQSLLSLPNKIMPFSLSSHTACALSGYFSLLQNVILELYIQNVVPALQSLFKQEWPCIAGSCTLWSPDNLKTCTHTTWGG